MMKKHTLYTLCSGVAMLSMLTACNSDTDEIANDEPEIISFTVKSQLEPMIGEPQTRISVDGSKFLAGDMIRLKAVTPFDHNSGQNHHAEFGESTYGGTIDNYFLLICSGEASGGFSKWSTSGFDSKKLLDLNGDGNVGDTSAPSLQYESQQTPYVYTANTWNRSVGFQTQTEGGKWRTIYKSTFYADQSIEGNFQSSDLLWAQIMMQTCTDQVTLSFHHVLSELLITIPNDMTNAIVLLHNMPDVDQQEFVVGDRYANTYYDYKNDPLSFSKISYVSDSNQNGKVIGISKMNGNEYALTKLTSITSKTSYVAFKENDTTFRVIVPPMKFSDDASIELRDVDANGKATIYRYNLKDQIKGLTDNSFVANTCYPITLKKKVTESSTQTTPKS